jgi:elongation factor 1-gamma
MSGLTLLTDAGNFRAFKILIAAEYNGLVIDIPDFKLTDRNTPAFLSKSPKVNQRQRHRLLKP